MIYMYLPSELIHNSSCGKEGYPKFQQPIPLYKQSKKFAKSNDFVRKFEVGLCLCMLRLLVAPSIHLLRSTKSSTAAASVLLSVRP